VERLLEGLAATCALARRRRRVGRIVLAVATTAGQARPDVASPFAFEPAVLDAVSWVDADADVDDAGAHNALFEAMAEDAVLVVDPDIYPSPPMLPELLTALDDPTVGIAEARQLPVEDPKSFDPGTGDTSWASGRCLLVRARVVAEVGGFDAELSLATGGDVDFSWRARLAGWRVVHRPAARAFRHVGLGADGRPVPAGGERRDRAEAAVLLPWRYSNKDLALEALSALAASPDGDDREVAAALSRRIAGDAVPGELDAEHRVAQFVEGAYAVDRFAPGPT